MSMSTAEFHNWKIELENTCSGWKTDTIHNGIDHKNAIYYNPLKDDSSKGWLILISADGVVRMGHYTNGQFGIIESTMFIEHTKKYDDLAIAQSILLKAIPTLCGPNTKSFDYTTVKYLRGDH